MNVLVTGANGFVGRAACAALRQARYTVVPAVRRSCGLAEERVVGEIGPHTVWLAALSGVDTVVHLAARVHVMRDTAANPLAAFRQVNVAGTLNLARQSAVAGIRRFVFVSSIKVNGEERNLAYTEADAPAPEDAYGISKWEAEQGLRQIAAETGMDIVILRPPLVYGPGVEANFLALMRAVAHGIPLPLGAIDNRRSLIFVGNLADAILRSLEHPAAAGKTFLVSDGEDVSTPELVRRMAYALGRPARLVSLPAPILRAVATLAGKSAQATRLMDSLIIDSGNIRRALGWLPPFSLNQGLQLTIVAYLSQRTRR